MDEYKRFLTLAMDAAYKGGEILKKFYGGGFLVDSKSNPADLVTEADRGAETAILQELSAHFPEHAILSEEGGGNAKKDSDYLWVVDPLDGTTNFTHGFPVFAISIGLLEKGKPVVAIVYNPIMGELFTAYKGGGALLNGLPIAVSSEENLQNSLLATGFAYDRWSVTDTNYLEFCHFTHISHGVRRLGAAAVDLAYVAAGRLDGYWERGLKPWDLAAGVLLVEEAGGLVTDYNGDPLDLYEGRILATNGALHPQMREELTKVVTFREEGHAVPLP